MITYKAVMREQQVIDTITCDKCGRKCDKDHHLACWYRGDYWSPPDGIGDFTEIQFELCEYCLVELNKTFLRNCIRYIKGEGED